MFYNINDEKSSSKYDLNVALQQSMMRHRFCEVSRIIVHMKFELITNGYKHSRDTQIALFVVIQAQIVFLLITYALFRELRCIFFIFV